MTELLDQELRRARWRRTLEEYGLDRIERDDFAARGLASRQSETSVQLLALPSDPEAEPIEFDDLWPHLEAHKTVTIEERLLRLGDRPIPTAHAAALVDSFGDKQPWNNYVAVHRCGAIELGLGQRGAREWRSNAEEPIRVFALIPIVAYSWALLKFGAALLERFDPAGPWQFTIGLRNTAGALLGSVAEGWAEAGEPENTVGGCHDADLLWHVEAETWPCGDDQRALAFAIGNRIEDAWGVQQRRYLANRGTQAGRLDLRKSV